MRFWSLYFLALMFSQLMGCEAKVASEQPLKSVTKYKYSSETNALRSLAACTRVKDTPDSNGFSALYSCIEGQKETAKLFVSGAKNSDGIKNVKVMWNDWFKDIGEGLHPDRTEAERLLTVVANRYAPNELEKIKAAFFGKQALQIAVGDFLIEVKHDKGPAIEEHLLVVNFR